MLNNNPVDILEAARDLTRKEEAEFLHNQLYDLFKSWEGLPEDEFDGGADGKTARLKGLEEAMLILDERIGYLRDRWG